MGKMAAQLAHQIRTPLSSALLYNSNLQDPKLTDVQKSNYLNKMKSRLKDLDKIVDDMLLFARGGSLTMVNIDIDSLLSDLQQVLCEKISNHKFIIYAKPHRNRSITYF